MCQVHCTPDLPLLKAKTSKSTCFEGSQESRNSNCRYSNCLDLMGFQTAIFAMRHDSLVVEILWHGQRLLQATQAPTMRHPGEIPDGWSSRVQTWSGILVP